MYIKVVSCCITDDTVTHHAEKIYSAVELHFIATRTMMSHRAVRVLIYCTKALLIRSHTSQSKYIAKVSSVQINDRGVYF